ncbi:E2 ubiquitin-conjugating protein [Starmerella bacillaris]|uniref:E2 ubiquitin-conjugating enzyme n=1 Tax=Starmerella bacillaris TaxID=1247836 RepID=A0AAV5RH71_STABA|nr:E2 ubiquitin-conjugating protein [Starmerella bacillaris]
MSKRLLKDLQAIKNDTEWHFTATPEESDLTKIQASFPGPAKSPYQGGSFVVEFDVPPEYPLKPPRAKFVTRVFHPNISSQTGAICLDILKDKWTPVYSLLSILISLQQLLDSPNAADPQDAEVAKVYNERPEEFERTAKEWTARYAKPAKAATIDDASVSPFLDMGFPKEKIIAVFEELGLTKINSDSEKEAVLNKLL